MSVQFKILIGILFTVATIVALVIYGINEDNRMKAYQTNFAGRSIQAGAEYYESYCATCHGEKGEGIVGKGPPLNRKDLLDLKATPHLKAINWNGTAADFIRNTIAAGRPQFSKYYADENYPQHMPTWSQDYGGPLRPDQVEALVSYILNWAPGEFEPLVAIVTPTPGPAPTPIPPEEILKAVPFPVPPSDAILAEGKTVYTKNCLACHGANRDGNGPGAVGSVKPPRNFTDCTVMQGIDLIRHHDSVVNGIPANGMPAWGKKLSNEEVWKVIMYEREPCKLFTP
ncbi:MAG: c-type cytochrome [Chloroflexi bacterium]|nr:c-type cytochrome [Chloroflexota bacterium]